MESNNKCVSPYITPIYKHYIRVPTKYGYNSGTIYCRITHSKRVIMNFNMLFRRYRPGTEL